MQTIITPRHIVESLCASEGRSRSFWPWSNAVEKWLFLMASGSFILGFLSALTTRTLEIDLRWWALGFLVASQVLAVVYQLCAMARAIRILSNPTQSISGPAADRFDKDVETITQLAATFDQHHLDYARDLLSQLVVQLRVRIGFMIGAIDKVGILPSAIAGYIYVKEILKSPDFSSSGIEWAFLGLSGFYILAVALLIVSQRIEHASLIAAHAATKKASDTKAISAARNGQQSS